MVKKGQIWYNIKLTPLSLQPCPNLWHPERKCELLYYSMRRSLTLIITTSVDWKSDGLAAGFSTDELD